VKTKINKKVFNIDNTQVKEKNGIATYQDEFIICSFIKIYKLIKGPT